MSNPLRSLLGMTGLLVGCALVVGGLSVWLWVESNANWRAHQDRAYLTGIMVHTAMQSGAAPSAHVRISPLSTSDQTYAEAGNFQQIKGAPRAVRITNVPLPSGDRGAHRGGLVSLAILSPDLIYRIADITRRDGQTPAETTGEVFRLLASFCSDPVVVGRLSEAPWVVIDGTSVWGCDVAPKDRRLLAALFAIIATGVLMTATLNLSSEFSGFADQLRNRRRVGGPARYDVQGPQELRDIVAAVNSHLESERGQLEGRAAVLSGVSHDLGTPATRLRLRAALIEDQDLRQKLEADIDSMTGMIESVLTFTRAEMNVEAPRKLSLTALIDAIVANYQDMGRTVTFRQADNVIVRGGASVFTSRQGQTVMMTDRQITITGRPIALERAVGNLIDNALKYGRRATIALETTADSITIVVEDEGSDAAAVDIEALMEPYKRGNNTATIAGHGLGLTIVATIAKLHGGSLAFEDSAKGVCAKLTILRN